MTTGSSQPLGTHAAIQSFTRSPAQPASQPEPTLPAAPTKRDLASWWKTFKRNNKKDEENKGRTQGGIFGVPLNVSIKYANVAISLTNDKGESFIYGYVPIVVAKCGVFLKEQATEVEGIFRLSGSARRIKELQEIFDSAERYGKGLDWTGYTVHDAANILRRYLNQLPEPIVPLDFYEAFREPLRNHQAQAVGSTETKDDTGDFDYEKAVATYQQLIRELPPLNKQLLLYILDLLAVFASKSEKNRMTSANLSAIFQPGLLSHPSHDMAPNEYRLSQDVLIFLIENQDNFLFGMNGTAADPQTVKEFQNSAAATAPTKAAGLRRSASNASGGADSLRKYENLRRNVSVSSRNSGNTQSPGTPTSTTNTVKRSNTVPSKKSPALIASRRGRNGEPTTPTSAGLPPPTETEQNRPTENLTDTVTLPTVNSTEPITSQTVSEQPTERSQFLDPNATPTSNVVTPTKERKLSNFFTKSPPTVPEQKEVRQPNRLKKKRIPGSTNASAQSSSHSLSGGISNDSTLLQSTSQVPTPVPATSNEGTPTIQETEPVPPVSTEGSHHHHQPSESTLKPHRSRSPSMHSKSSFTDHSEFEQGDDTSKAEKREHRKSWRFPLSRQNHEQPSSPPLVGLNSGAEFSSSSIGSFNQPQRSFANDSHAPSTDITSTQDTDIGRSTSNLREGAISPEPEKRSIFEKIKAKVAPKKDGSDRGKSPQRSDFPPANDPPQVEEKKQPQIEQPTEVAPESSNAPAPQPAPQPAQDSVPVSTTAAPETTAADPAVALTPATPVSAPAPTTEGSK
ncbi:putative Rho GTPase activator [Talaromyces proteolyticus]|uniref:Rho GTPase activator n=1 Tax=Talaromyces proteolyticus TaxID=1131652 RepID=A0AAD4PYK3_9EURO|nr:putative Rho GTPase activator [Talaromyces proteolyticus]KAH8694887.1 putative Rho GTPase activator [Talaromyces proteolyticus]